mmetsp:Transcript_32980/g.71895  ORF Transcript_32980/g.71895 Transcript_32980/m.71895 type:complete len:316 (-) Transcript_32980:1463-2410(-)
MRVVRVLRRPPLRRRGVQRPELRGAAAVLLLLPDAQPPAAAVAGARGALYPVVVRLRLALLLVRLLPLDRGDGGAEAARGEQRVELRPPPHRPLVRRRHGDWARGPLGGGGVDAHEAAALGDGGAAVAVGLFHAFELLLPPPHHLHLVHLLQHALRPHHAPPLLLRLLLLQLPLVPLEGGHAVVGDLGHGRHRLRERVEDVVEVVLEQAVQLAVFGRGHVRRAVDVLDEADLPEVGAGGEVGDDLVVGGHLDLAVPDEEHRLAGLPLADDDLVLQEHRRHHQRHDGRNQALLAVHEEGHHLQQVAAVVDRNLRAQ